MLMRGSQKGKKSSSLRYGAEQLIYFTHIHRSFQPPLFRFYLKRLISQKPLPMKVIYWWRNAILGGNIFENFEKFIRKFFNSQSNQLCSRVPLIKIYRTWLRHKLQAHHQVNSFPSFSHASYVHTHRGCDKYIPLSLSLKKAQMNEWGGLLT